MNNKDKAQVVALGELLIDFTMVGADNQGYPTLAAHPGGAPANFLATLSKAGIKSAMLGKVGADKFGDILTATLAEHGIDTSGLIHDETVFTTLAFVTLDSKGDRDFSFARKPGADTCIHFDELDLSLIDDAKVFHFGSLSLTDEPARTATYKTVEYAKQHDKIISYDPNLRKPLWRDLAEAKKQILWGLAQADVVKISDEEVEFLFGLEPVAGAEYIMSNYNTKLVFVTCGDKGCYFRNAVAFGYMPSLENVVAVDTTGAGDVFAGSVIYKLLSYGKSPENLNKTELEDVAKFACTNAGLSITKQGGISGIPDIDDVLQLL